MSITPGSRLGPYEILAPIGAGGMGEVFKARDTRLDRSVAIKVLPPDLAANAQLRLRLEREARAISQLNHPNICTLFDVGDGFLVMELLEGETLADRIGRGPLPVPEALRLGVQIADALDKAHRAGIVHRDLKPSNVMLTKSGAKLVDFGLAKPTSALSPQSSVLETAAKPLTQEGTVIGTFQYMSPEQLEGIEADARTDIFAFGCVLYEMLTGKRAFEGKTRTSLIAAIVSSEPPPLSQIQPLTPPALEHVMRKCLAKDPDDRWQSAHDVAEELRWIGEAGSQAGVAAPLTMRRKSRERLAWTLLAAAILAAVLLAVRALRPPEPHRTYRFSIPMFGEGFSAPLTSIGYTNFAISADGQVIAFNALDAAGKRRIWLRRLGDDSSRLLAGSEGMTVIQFAPDRESLLVSSPGKLVRLPLDSGSPEVIAEMGAGRLAPDGSILFAGPDRRYYRLAPGAASPQAISILDKSRSEIYHFGLRVLPDGEHFLFISYRRPANATSFLHDLYIGSIKGEPAVRVGDIPSRAEYALGHLFFVRDSTLVAAPFDVKKKKFTGQPVAVVSNVRYFKPTGAASFEVANDGTIVYRHRGVDRLQWFDLHGNRLAQLATRATWDPRFHLSADETQIYVSEYDSHDGVSRQWAYGVARDTKTRMSFGWADEGVTTITPDGQHVIYASDRLDEPDIYIRDIDGGNDRVLVQAPGVQYDDDISKDGKFLLYDSTEGGAATNKDIMALPLSPGGKPFPVVRTPAVEGYAVFSPDGKWIAYESNESGERQIYIKQFPPAGAARQVSVAGGINAHWSRDGKSLFFCNRRTLMAADVTNGVPADPRPMFEIAETIENFAVSRDGKRLLLLTAPDEDISPPLNVITGWRPPSK